MLSVMLEFLDIGVIRMGYGLSRVILDQIGVNGIKPGDSVVKNLLIRSWESLM
jgi:hypothetical protein